MNTVKIEYHPRFSEVENGLRLYPRLEFQCGGCDNHMVYPLLKGYEYDRLESIAYVQMIEKFRKWSFSTFDKDVFAEFEESLLTKMIFELENYPQVTKTEVEPIKE